jgi:hypothetical protein
MGAAAASGLTVYCQQLRAVKRERERKRADDVSDKNQEIPADDDGGLEGAQGERRATDDERQARYKTLTCTNGCELMMIWASLDDFWKLINQS